MNKKISLFLLLFVSVVLGAQAQHKNILFIAVDDLKPVLSCYGESQIVTPHIDKLASKGIVFNHAYCGWSVCGPSRSSMLTGLTPDGSCVKNLTTHFRDTIPNVITMPQFFKNKGYETVAIGKIFDKRNVDDGHDSVSWTREYIPNTAYSYPEEYGDFVSGQYRVTASTVTEQGPEGVDFDGYEDGQSCLSALDRLDEFSDSGKSFFLAVGFKKPHIPFIAPKKYWDLYDRDTLNLAVFQGVVTDGPDYIYYKPEPLPYKYVDMDTSWNYLDITDTMPVDDQKRIVHGYYACVSYIDDLVGMLLNKLEETGLDKNTIIVLWGDHGYHLGDHNQWGKHTNFENGTHLPLIIAVPDGKGGISYRPADSYDIYPTLVDLAGFNVPNYVEGNLLTPAIKGDTLKKTCAVSQFRAGGNMGYSFRTERYRFTVWMDKTTYIPTVMEWDANKIEDIELYDYIADPLEKKNHINDVDYISVKDSLMAIAKNWWNEQYYFFTTGANSKFIQGFNYILNNPDFEQGIDVNWNTSTSGSFNATVTQSSDAYSGVVAMQIDIKDTGTEFSDGVLISDEYNCLSGMRQNEVFVSLKAKSTENTFIKTAINIKKFDETEQVIESYELPVSENYDSLGFVFTLPEATLSWSVSVLYGKSLGTVTIDDLIITIKSDDKESVSVGRVGEKQGIKIYPNPIDKYLFAEGDFSKSAELKIYNLNGNLLISKSKDINKTDVSMLGSGIYIVEINNGIRSLTQKVIVE